MNSLVLIGGSIGLSKSLEDTFLGKGWDVRRVEWSKDARTWEALENNIRIAIHGCHAPIMIVVTHLGCLYPKLFKFFGTLRGVESFSRVYLIGSTTSDRTKRSLDLYNIEKKMLAALVLQVQQDPSHIPISLLRPGAIDTPRVAHLTGPKMTTLQAASVIFDLIQIEYTSSVSFLDAKFIKAVE